MAQPNDDVKSRVKNLREVLEKMDVKEKVDATGKSPAKDKKGQQTDQLSDLVSSMRQTIGGNKTEEEKLNKCRSLWKTFIVHDVPKEWRSQADSLHKLLQDSSGTIPETVGKPRSGQKHAASSQTPAQSTNMERTTNTAPSSLESLKPTPGGSSPSVNRKRKPEDENAEELLNLEKQLEKLKQEYSDLQCISEKRKQELEEKEKELNANNILIDQQKKEMETREEEVKDITKSYDQLNAEYTRVKKEKDDLEHKLLQSQSLVKEKEEFSQNLEKKLNESDSDVLALQNQLKIFEDENIKQNDEKIKLNEEKRMLEKKVKSLNREIDGLKDAFALEKRKTDDNIQKLIKERDDLRDRFSKVAGAKLSDQNADIADLSDPNRAMKISERFGQLYDDEWTNAFEALSDTDKKICLPPKEAIALLLKLLKECLDFCQKIKSTQMESLINVFLHPVQNPQIAAAGGMPNLQDKSDKSKFGAKEEKTLRELRRQIAVQPFVTEQVKQAFIITVKSGHKEMAGFDKKHIEVCIPYLSKCADLCWMMVIHDPPLFVKFDVKQGDKLDPNVYSVYSTSGDKIDFLVWPPLYNGEGGGLLAKGAAEPLRVMKKGK